MCKEGFESVAASGHPWPVTPSVRTREGGTRRSAELKRGLVDRVIVLVKLVLPPLHLHLLPVCLFFSSPFLLPSLPHLHSYLISLCFSTVHHYLFVRSPLSSIILSHRFPSYYRGICLHLSKNNTHTHTHVGAQLCVRKTIAGVLLCAGGAVWFDLVFLQTGVPWPGFASSHWTCTSTWSEKSAPTDTRCE